MRVHILVAVVLSIWTYGSEPLDILAARGEWDTFASQLQCQARDADVWCFVNGEWKTIDNQPLSVPWGLETSTIFL